MQNSYTLKNADRSYKKNYCVMCFLQCLFRCLISVYEKGKFFYNIMLELESVSCFMMHAKFGVVVFYKNT